MKAFANQGNVWCGLFPVLLSLGCRTPLPKGEVLSDSSAEKIDLGFSTASTLVPIGATGFCATRNFRYNTNIIFDKSIHPGAPEENSKFDETDTNIETNLYWMNLASVIAYLPEKDATEQFKKHFGASRVTFVEGKRDGIMRPLSIQAYIVEIDHETKFDINPMGNQKQKIKSAGPTIFVVFAGTQLDESADVITDVRNSAKQMPDPLGRGTIGHVHSGFLDAIMLTWPKIFAATKGIDKPIFITGHSMGGALAVLASAMYLAVNDPQTHLKAVYTFGAPRTGLGNFVEWYDQSMKNLQVGMRMVAIDDDPVTAIPDNISGLIGGSMTHIFKGGWKHVGQNSNNNEYVLWIKTRPQRIADKGSEALQRLTLKGRHFLLKLGQGFKDHAQLNYLPNIEEMSFTSRSNCGKSAVGTAGFPESIRTIPTPDPKSFDAPPIPVEGLKNAEDTSILRGRYRQLPPAKL